VGAILKALNNQEHYEELLKFLVPPVQSAPSLSSRISIGMRTVDDLCRFSGLAPRQDPDSGLFSWTATYFGILVAKTMPPA